MKYSPIQNFIGGKFISASTNRQLQVISPIDGIGLSEVPMSSSIELNDAVQVAKTAFLSWSKTPVKERVQVFFKYKTLLEKNLQELAELRKRKNNWGIYCRN